MPFTSSNTDIAINKLLNDTAKHYRPNSTNSKPMHQIEKLFIQALSNSKIKSAIQIYILTHLKDYE